MSHSLKLLTMKTARSFVRRVRSKSPFRRRKRAETLVAEVRQKEQAFMQQLTASTDQTSRTSLPDDQAEIEVVLESSPLPTNFRSHTGRSVVKTPPRREDAVPDLVASSSASTEDPPLSNAQAAAQRFMERQQRIAAGNRRKSFRDRFMRSPKNTSAPPPPPSPAKSTKQMGISVRGRGRSVLSASSSAREQSSKAQERGRSKERSVRGSIRGSSSKSKLSRDQEHGLKEDNAPDQRFLPQQLQSETGFTVDQPVTIDVGVQSRVSELSTPAAIIRQESLGTESIRGVRQALQKMELELAAAGDAGKRVSRDKIMNALNFMANSLHYDDQKQALVKELDAWIDESVIATDRGHVYADEEDDDNSDDETSCSDDASGSTFDLDAFEDGRSTASTRKQKQQQTQNSFQDLFLRLGKFFTISDEDKTAVRQALDDLLWTELADSSRRPATKVGESLLNQDDRSESSGDSIGNFDPLSCNIPDTNMEPSAPMRGRSWWRRHTLGGSNTKKENLLPVQEHPPSPESKISVPSPTGKVDPRSSKTRLASKSLGCGGKSLGSGEKSSRSGKSSGSGKSPSNLPQPPTKQALTERTAVAKSRYMMDESDHSGWSSFDDTASDFWRQGDRYTIPSQPKVSTQQAQLVNHYKLSYPHSWPENDPFSDSDFLDSPREEDDFDDWDNCLHPAENYNH